MAANASKSLKFALETLQSDEIAANPPSSDWQIGVAVCFERYPRVTPDRTPEEQAWGT